MPGTLTKAIGLAKSMRHEAAFILQTDDITQLSKPAEFDTAHEINKGAGMMIHHVPGEHDKLDPGKRGYLARYGNSTKGMGWCSFDAGLNRTYILLPIIPRIIAGMPSAAKRSSSLAWA